MTASTSTSFTAFRVLQPTTMWFCFLVCLVLEIAFYLFSLFYLKPKANDLKSKTIKPYRDYGKRRHLLFERILNRLETKCKLENKEMDSVLHDFLRSWFFTPSTNNRDLYHLTPGSTSISGMKNAEENYSYTSSPCTSQEEKLQVNSPQKQFILLQSKSTSMSSSAMSSEDIQGGDNSNNNDRANQNWNNFFYKEDLLEFFTWAFFDKRHCELNEEWEKEELNKMFHILESRYGFIYPTYREAMRKQQNRQSPIISRTFSLEKCNPLHRPFALYIIFLMLRLIGYLILFWKGFRRHQIRIQCKGRQDKFLSYWFRDQKPSSEAAYNRLDPILFFHGIAPAGLTLYLPFLLNTIAKGGFNSSNKDHERDNPIFLIENLPITCSLVFDAFTEEETVEGVDRILLRHGFISPQEGGSLSNQVILCGHSFGSFQVTWLLKSLAVKDKIKKIILLDPVSILLSDPDVVTNFLYNARVETLIDQSPTEDHSIIGYVNRVKIRAFASSELGIEYYLRRHFAWYNSELWLEDIPNSVDVSVYIAEKDEIINVRKVKEEIEKFSNVKLTCWKDVGHGAALTRSKLWFDLFNDIESTQRSKKIN